MLPSLNKDFTCSSSALSSVSGTEQRRVIQSKEVTEGEKCVTKRMNAASSQPGALGMMESKSKKVDEEAGLHHVTEIDDKPAE